MLISRLEIRNMRKIKQAEIDFHGPGLQIIQGMNKSGKTTIAQSIALTLEGPKSFVPGMITHGEEQAEVVAYTDDGLQIRTIIKDTPKDGVKQTVSRFDEGMGRYVNLSGGVRSFLDSIRSGLEMPWSLRSMTDAKVIEILKDRAGISQKIAEIDVMIRDRETARTEVGRDKKKIGDLGEAPEEIEHPPAMDELKTEREAASNFLKVQREAMDKAAEYIRSKCVFSTVDDIAALESVIEAAVKRTKEIIGEAGKPYTRADIDDMDKRFVDWNTEEEKAKKWDAYCERKKELERLTEQYETLTREIEALRESRKKTLAGITLIKGLEIREDNFLYYKGTLRGITETNKEDNWSTAESVQVFFSIGANFSGKMKVLVVDNAESLDDVTTDIISKWAEKSSFLVILLKVANFPEEPEEGIIYVKEGEIITKPGAAHGEQ
jgi:DNA repair exonuclease SbcCD ATPase subunit